MRSAKKGIPRRRRSAVQGTLLSLVAVTAYGEAPAVQPVASARLATANPEPAQGGGSGLGSPAPGSFLIASRTLLDPNFVETVILLVDYDSKGAMGLIINRPSDMQLSTMLPEIEGLEDRRDTIWLGGPVSRWQMVLLARSHEGLQGSRNVLSDVYFSASRVVLERLVHDGAEFRVYAGYAGWSQGQLDREIARGGWHVLPGDAGMVFDEAPGELWHELIRRSRVQWADRDMPSAPRTQRLAANMQSRLSAR